MTNPFGITIFCDDFRLEAGGKMLFIGAYPGDLNIEAKPPVVLPTFSAMVQLRVPIDIEVSSLKISILKKTVKNIEEIARVNHEFMGGMPPFEAPPAELSMPDDELFYHFGMPFSWSPFRLDESCALRVRAVINNEIEFKVGGIRLNIINPDSKELVL